MLTIISFDHNYGIKSQPIFCVAVVIVSWPSLGPQHSRTFICIVCYVGATESHQNALKQKQPKVQPTKCKTIVSIVNGLSYTEVNASIGVLARSHAESKPLPQIHRVRFFSFRKGEKWKSLSENMRVLQRKPFSEHVLQ